MLKPEILTEIVKEYFEILVEDIFEDLDKDNIEDHLDSDLDGDGYDNSVEQDYGFDPLDTHSRPELPIVQSLSPKVLDDGSYQLEARILSFGGIEPEEIGFLISNNQTGQEQYLLVDANLSEGENFSFKFSSGITGETYFYRAYASNLAGHSLGSPRKITIENSALGGQELMI